MGAGTKTNEPGLLESFMIDGDTYEIPRQYVPQSPLAQSIFTSLAGTNMITATYRGDGLPDRPDSFSFQLPYDIDINNGMTADQVEVLRATPGPHVFADFKQRVYHYSLRAGQQFLYLPREDAFGKWAIGSVAELVLDGTAIATVDYKTSVEAGDAVPAATAWISTTLIRHPDSGRWAAPFKLGDTIGAPAILVVKYFPVFRVDATDVQTNFGAGVYAREDKVLSLVEVN